MDEIIQYRLLKVVELNGKDVLCQDVNGNTYTLVLENLDVLKGDVLKPVHKNYIKFHDSSSESACLFVTNKCNSNCLMCPDTMYSRQKMNDISLSFLQEHILLLPTDLPFLDITGGEPTLLKSNLIVLIDVAFKHFEHISIMLLSNGRAFADKDYSGLFSKYRRQNFIIEIPIHGFNSVTHDRIARDRGCFLQTISGIQNLIRGEVQIGIRIVVSGLNLSFIHKIIHFIGTNFQKKVKYINLMGLEMLGNAYLNKEQVWIEYDEIKNILQKNIELCFLYGIEPRLYNFPLCLFDKKYWSVYRKSISPNKIVYLESCFGCGIKNYCGGFFKSTAHITKYRGKEEI